MKNAAHHQGLSEQQVQENRTRYGVNILTPPEKEPLWKQFLEKFSDPIIKILLVALLLSVGVACYQFLTGAESASVFLEPAGILAAILLLGAVVVEDAAPAAVWLPVLVVLLLPMNFQRGSLPEKNAEMAAQMQTVEAALTASVQDAGADPWDHTLAYAYDDGVFHGYLYAVPDGMGIEFDKNSYLWDEENPISSRYVMCGHDTRVAARLLAENWQQVVSTEDLVIYKRP